MKGAGLLAACWLTWLLQEPGPCWPLNKKVKGARYGVSMYQALADFGRLLVEFSRLADEYYYSSRAPTLHHTQQEVPLQG